MSGALATASQEVGLDAEALLSRQDRAALDVVRAVLGRCRYGLSVELTRDGRLRFIVWHGLWCRHFYMLADVREFANGCTRAMHSTALNRLKWNQAR